MFINHNMASLNTYRQLNINEGSTQKSLEKLSSGLRINKAGDDAAGLAISEKMRGQIRGLDQATRNAQDGISMIQTAEGALNETHSILQRMRELAVQAGSDTNTTQDRDNIQKEMDQLGTEITRISDNTEYNTKKLLNGGMGKAIAAAVANVNENIALATGTDVTTVAVKDLQARGGASLGIVSTDTIDYAFVVNGALHTGSVIISGTKLQELIETDGFMVASNSSGNVHAVAASAGTAAAVYGLTFTVKDASGNVKSSATNALSAFAQSTAAADQRSDGSANILIGANTGQSINVSLDKMDAGSLGVKDIKVTTQGSADIAIKVIDTAINTVSGERATIGALGNRLEHTINNLGTSSENLTAAESRVRDVDMAKEMTNFQKNNILQQAAQAMLAQANQQPQGVLQLLR